MSAANAIVPSTRQVLTFGLATESYGIDILQVQEIRGWSPVTRIPQADRHVLGVLNLRGSIVPIVDLRVRFGLEAVFTPLTVIIVVSLITAQGRRECGLVVDRVADVVDIDPAALREPPELDGASATDFIASLATVGARMLILLDVERLLSHTREPLSCAS